MYLDKTFTIKITDVNEDPTDIQVRYHSNLYLISAILDNILFDKVNFIDIVLVSLAFQFKCE